MSMGLAHALERTYDTRIPGARYGDGSFPLAPLAHTVTQADIEVTLDPDGNFRGARRRETKSLENADGTWSKPEQKIVIPVTEDSLGRTSKAAVLPHYLCDYVSYMDPVNGASYEAYVSQLAGWAAHARSPKLDAVLAYVGRGTIVQDLEAAGACPGQKDMVCWRFVGFGEDSGPCWTDKGLMESLVGYHLDRLEAEGRKKGPCMVSGDDCVLARSHAKGVVAKHGNAKLVSMNSSTNNKFTYQGRFRTGDEALTIGYVTSQKVHNALAALVANDGVMLGDRTFLCWNPEGHEVPVVTGGLRRGSQAPEQARIASFGEYRRQLRDAVLGWSKDLPRDAKVVFTVLDSPSSGCLSILYYGELPVGEYLERLEAWESTCCEGFVSPSLKMLATYAYGTPRGKDYGIRFEALREQVQRLVLARWNGTPFPVDIKDRLVVNASRLLTCAKKGENGKGSPRGRLLRAACSAVRKYMSDMGEEVPGMTLDVNCRDRSYVFGRLLAVADRIEDEVLRKKKKKEDRETCALRLQRAFVQCPLSTWKTIHGNLGPYFKQMKGDSRRFWNDKIAGIMGLFETDDPHELNLPLGDTYLLGYYAQRADFWTKPGKGSEAQDGAEDGSDDDVGAED